MAFHELIDDNAPQGGNTNFDLFIDLDDTTGQQPIDYPEKPTSANQRRYRLPTRRMALRIAGAVVAASAVAGNYLGDVERTPHVSPISPAAAAKAFETGLSCKLTGAETNMSVDQGSDPNVDPTAVTLAITETPAFKAAQVQYPSTGEKILWSVGLVDTAYNPAGPEPVLTYDTITGTSGDGDPNSLSGLIMPIERSDIRSGKNFGIGIIDNVLEASESNATQSISFLPCGTIAPEDDGNTWRILSTPLEGSATPQPVVYHLSPADHGHPSK